MNDFKYDKNVFDPVAIEREAQRLRGEATAKGFRMLRGWVAKQLTRTAPQGTKSPA